MRANHKSLEERVSELEGLLAEANAETRYYQQLAEETEEKSLREIRRLSKLISEHKQVEAALQESHDKLESLFELSPLAIAVINFETEKLLDVNHKFCELVKQDPEQIIGKTTGDFGLQSEDDRRRFFEELEASGEVHEFEMTYTLKDASIIHTIIFARLLRLRGKNLILSVSYDNTERMLQEEALRKSEEKYRQLANLLPQIVFETDEKGNLTFTNHFALDNLGYTKDEFNEGVNLLEAIVPQDRAKARKRVQRIMEGEKLVSVEYTALRKDGSTFPVMAYSTPIIGNGKPLGIRGIMADLSEVKRVHEALRESEKKIAGLKKMEALGLLAGGVAHDLNNVLSGIVCIPEIILMDIPDDSNIRKPVEEIQKSGNRATAIVQDLVTVARGATTPREPLNINDMAREYLGSPEFEKLKNVNSSVAFITSLASGLSNINGSPIHIQKVLMNLVSNASEAVAGSGNVTISTSNYYLDNSLKDYTNVNRGDYVRLSVSDDGPGISASDLERIFEPFYTKKIMGRSGTGLGLSVVWSVVQDHEGYIDVITNENGTTFDLYFPVTKDAIYDMPVPIPLDELKGNGATVLVIDDLETQRDISTQMLAALGYESLAVSSGEEAVEYLAGRKVDLILLDMILGPGMSGREAYEEIIKIHPNQKTVIVSGFIDTDDVKEIQKLGAGQSIKKPLTLEKLGLAIKHELA